MDIEEIDLTVCVLRFGEEINVGSYSSRTSFYDVNTCLFTYNSPFSL